MFQNCPLPAFGSTVASQDLEEGQMGVVEVKEQLTRDSLNQQPLSGRKELVTGMGVPANFKFRSR